MSLLGEAMELPKSQFSEAIHHLSDEAKAQLLEAISQVISHLRSGKARKAGDKGALSRIGTVVSSAAARASEIAALAEKLGRLGEEINNLDGDQLGASVMDGIKGGIQDNQSGSAELQGLLSGLMGMSAVAQGMEAARAATEATRQVKLLLNSSVDLASGLNAADVQDELLDKLEDQLKGLAMRFADVGAQEAENFLNQKLKPEEWLKEVQRE